MSYRIALLLSTYILLGACVSEISPNLPVDDLARIKLATQFEILASASDPTSKLPLEALPPGYEVELVGVDKSGAWLLIFDGSYVGWMPTFVSSTPSDRLDPPLVIEPLDGACTRYMGATFEPNEPWLSSSDDPVIIEGSIYRPEAGPDFVDATLAVSIAGAGEATAAEYVHVPLTPNASIVLFAFALDGLDQGSRVTFELEDPSGEPVIFQASFFTDKCGTDWRGKGARFVRQLPIGEPKLELPKSVPTPAPRASTTPARGPTPTPGTVAITSGDRLNSPTRGEIQSLVDQWDRIHHEADLSLDPSDLSLVLTGGALRQQETTLENLRKSDCYWEFSDIRPSKITGWEEISVNEVIVTMRKHWDGRLYCKGKFNAKESFDDPFDVRYQIVRTSQGWRIAETVILGSTGPDSQVLPKASPSASSFPGTPDAPVTTPGTETVGTPSIVAITTPVGSTTRVPTTVVILPPVGSESDVVELETPPKLSIEQSRTIRITLQRTDLLSYLPTKQITESVLFTGTIPPVATPSVSLKAAFGSGYILVASAKLISPDLEITPASPEIQPYDVDSITWIFVVSGRKPGLQSVAATITVRWIPEATELNGKSRNEISDSIERQVWHEQFDIEVTEPVLRPGSYTWGELWVLFGGTSIIAVGAGWILRDQSEKRTKIGMYSQQVSSLSDVDPSSDTHDEVQQ